jgi:hypothetical protein
MYGLDGELAGGRSSRWWDMIVRDRRTGLTRRVCPALDEPDQPDYSSFRHVISGNGRYVAFQSEANYLVPDETNGYIDVFVQDLRTDQTERVNVSAEGQQADSEYNVRSLAISSDGRYVAFTSDATNLVPDDTNDASDVFIRDRGLLCTCGDIDNSGGRVDLVDFATFAACYGLSAPQPPDCDGSAFACADLNGDGEVNLGDFAMFSMVYGKQIAHLPPDCDL